MVIKKKKILSRPLRLYKNSKGERYVIINNKKVPINSELSAKDLLKFVLKRLLSRRKGRTQNKKLEKENIKPFTGKIKAVGASNVTDQLQRDLNRIKNESKEKEDELKKEIEKLKNDLKKAGKNSNKGQILGIKIEELKNDINQLQQIQQLQFNQPNLLQFQMMQQLANKPQQQPPKSPQVKQKKEKFPLVIRGQKINLSKKKHDILSKEKNLFDEQLTKAELDKKKLEDDKKQLEEDKKKAEEDRKKLKQQRDLDILKISNESKRKEFFSKLTSEELMNLGKKHGLKQKDFTEPNEGPKGGIKPMSKVGIINKIKEHNIINDGYILSNYNKKKDEIVKAVSDATRYKKTLVSAPPTPTKLQKQEKEEEEEDITENPNIEQPDFNDEDIEENIKGAGKMNKGLYGDQIEKYMNKYKKYGFKGVYPIDKIHTIPVSKKMSFIFNTDKSNQPGQHWIAVYIDANDKKEIGYIDSFGQDPTPEFMKQIKILIDKIKSSTYLLMKVNKIVEQRANSYNCGYFAMKSLNDYYKGKHFKDITPFNESRKDEKNIKKFKEKFRKFKYI